MAATAVLSQEALGAHGVDRCEERIAGELGVAAKTGERRGIRRPRAGALR